jgi:PEP-CTERM motif
MGLGRRPEWSFKQQREPSHCMFLTAPRLPATLLVGASIAALAMLGGLHEAEACSPSTQQIKNSVTGPVLSNGGAIDVTSAGDISGGPEGVYAKDCNITTLSNDGTVGAGALGSGVLIAKSLGALTNTDFIRGGAGLLSNSSPGGAGVSNAGTVTSISNSGAIDGGYGSATFLHGTDGGSGLSNQLGATIDSLTNLKTGTIQGGGGGFGPSSGDAGAGGAGVSNAGTITALTNKGAIGGGDAGGGASSSGNRGGDGILNSGAIDKLANSGSIDGGFAMGHGGWSGGAGIMNSGTIKTLSNTGSIAGGAGAVIDFAAGGAGIMNSGVIQTLSNEGSITGGAAGRDVAPFPEIQLNGGAGVANAHAINQLSNAVGATITGAEGALGYNAKAGAGGAGVSNEKAATIGTLTNNGKIFGGAGGSGPIGGAGGAGVLNAGALTTLANAGTMIGGAGGAASMTAGAGGAGLLNSGTIVSLTNAGTIEGARGGKGATNGVTGDAIHSAGKGASIGSITNSGSIIGNVEIAGQDKVTIYGGSGKAFGSWTGGTITIGGSDLDFAGGNTALGDDVVVKGGAGIVHNHDPLRISSQVTITGGFDQSASGELDFDLGGLAASDDGKLDVTGGAQLGGVLGIDLVHGFALARGDVFDLMSFASYTGGFADLSFNGDDCSASGDDIWVCSNLHGLGLKEDLRAHFLDLDVVKSTVAAVPEPATWTMLGIGFLGLGGIALRRRSAPSSAR